MTKTLLTGANSFVGAHIINALIEAGHHVTGTVRRASAIEDIFSLHSEWKKNLDLVVVADYGKQEAWNEVLQNGQFDHIVHVAAPLLDNPANTDYDRDFLNASVDANLSLLKSAYEVGSTVKSIAITGSINACTTGSPEELTVPITNSTWLPISRDQAREAKNAYISYCSGKKEGELAVWDFIKTAAPEPTFSVTVFLPALIFGPPIQPVKSIQSLNYSSNVIYGLFNGTYDLIPPTSFPSSIDVRDLATAHVRALTYPEARNKRFLISGKPMTYTAIVRALKKVPGLEERVPKESGEDQKVPKVIIDAEEGNKALDITFRALEQTIFDTAERLLELERNQA